MLKKKTLSLNFCYDDPGGGGYWLLVDLTSCEHKEMKNIYFNRFRLGKSKRCEIQYIFILILKKRINTLRLSIFY